MKNFLRDGRGMAVGQSDKVTKLHRDTDLLRRPKEEKIKYPLSNSRPLHYGRGDVACGWRLLPANSHLLLAFTIIFCVLFSCLLVSPALGQEATGLNKVQPLMIGNKVPDDFWTREHLFYVNGDTVRKTLEEYKGKMLVLDFYMSGCGMCLEHQKEISYFKEEYPNEIAIIMVNSLATTEKYDRINRLYRSGFFERAGMKDFISIIEDDYLERLFPYKTFPSYFWINKNGFLQIYTYRNLLDRNYIPPFLDR